MLTLKPSALRLARVVAPSANSIGPGDVMVEESHAGVMYATARTCSLRLIGRTWKEKTTEGWTQ